MDQLSFLDDSGDFDPMVAEPATAGQGAHRLAVAQRRNMPFW
jgi:hypothetical protein